MRTRGNDDVPHTFRLRRSEELRVRASELLEIATHHRIQDFLRRALSDIDDADHWLYDVSLSTSPALMTVVDMDLALAEYRIQTAKLALTLRGPDVDALP